MRPVNYRVPCEFKAFQGNVRAPHFPFSYVGAPGRLQSGISMAGLVTLCAPAPGWLRPGYAHTLLQSQPSRSHAPALTAPMRA